MKSPPTGAAGAGERRRSALALHKEKKRAQVVFHEANDSPRRCREQCQPLLGIERR